MLGLVLDHLSEEIKAYLLDVLLHLGQGVGPWWLLTPNLLPRLDQFLILQDLRSDHLPEFGGLHPTSVSGNRKKKVGYTCSLENILLTILLLISRTTSI